MPEQNVARVNFNRGKVSALALSRTDIERVELSAEEQTNFVPRVLGSMMLRPGWKYLSSTLGDNPAYNIEFIKSTDDTALLEFTNSSMRVRVDDSVVTRNAVSTTIRGGDFAADVTNFNKVSDPSSLPGANCNGIAFSNDGQLLAVATDAASSRLLDVYSVSGTTLTKLTAPASGPTTGVGNGVAFSPNGDLLALAHDGAAGFDVWAITSTGASATFTHLTTSALNPGDTARGIAFSADGLWMAIAHDTSPFVSIYAVSGTGVSASFTLQSNPSSLPAGNGQSVAFSYDSRYLAVGHATTPFVTLYDINGTTFTKLSDPGSLPAGQGNGVAFSRDGLWFSVAHATTPFVTNYAITGTGTGSTFTKQSNPGTLPDGTGRGVAFSPDSQFLAVAHDTSVFFSHYRLVSNVWTKQTDLSTAPDGIGNGVAFSPNHQLMVVAHDTTQFLSAYEAYQWLDMDNSGAASTYLSGNFEQSSNWTFDTEGNNSSLNNATVRAIIDAGLLTRSGNRIRLTFQSHSAASFQIDSCYIGVRASSGDAWDFASAPTQITFDGGSAGFAIGTAATKLSDQITFEIDEAESYILAFHIVGSAPGMKVGTSIATNTYYKTGLDTTTVNATGYSNLSGAVGYTGADLAGVTKIEVMTSVATTGLSLVGTGYNEARRTQVVSVSNTDKATEHGIRVVIARGEVLFHVGTGFGDDDLVTSRTLEPGTYSFAFTPNANIFYVEVHATTKYASIVSSVTIDAAGDLSLPTSYTDSDLNNIRYAQSGDVLYLACMELSQKKVLRYAERSWGISEYQPKDGPFRDLNTSLITLTASALTGDITLTSSREYFKSNMVGALFRIDSVGQATQDSFTGANQFSGEIRVTGVGTSRDISIVRSGTWSATVTLQRSISEPGTWVDVATFTTNGTATYNDSLDNQIIYYRIGIKTGNYTSGTAVVSLSYSSGSIGGIARIITYTSPTVVSAIVLSPMGGTSAFESWSEGAWSDYRGFPTSVCLHEGRLWWAGNDKIWGSASDDYERFDSTQEGDAKTISRSIGEGPVDVINWLLPLQRMLVGTEGSELSAKSNSFDEPLTASNFTLKACSTHGSDNVGAIRIDDSGVFVHRNGTRLMQLAYDVEKYDYSSSELTRLVPDICSIGIKRIGVQRLPDTRIHCVKNDGTVAMLLFDRVEDVIGWVDIETDGEIEDVAVLPATPEDAVYYVVKRTINSQTKRYLERWAREDECQGDAVTKCVDSHLIYSGASSATITGLDHLEGETVTIWSNGADVGTKVVASGSITLDAATTSAVIGLPYTARYKSTKLAYAAANGSALNIRKRVQAIGLVLYKTHAFGLRIGDSFDNLRGMPTMRNNKAVGANEIYETYDNDLTAYNTNWSTDSRLCIEANSPRPATVLALTFNIDTNG